MQIHVTFTTQIKAALGMEQETLSLEDGAAVSDAIEALAARHGEVFSQYVLSEDRLLPSIFLSLNDHQVDMSKRLTDGDHLILLSAISGG